MKRIIAIMLAVSMLFAFAACAKTEKADQNEAAKQDETEQNVGMPNPMREVTAEELEFDVHVPEGAEDVKYFIIEDGDSKMDQVTYTLNGKDYCYRMQQTNEVASYDMSGIYADKWEIEDAEVSYCEAVVKICSEGSVIYWLDVVPGVNYTLSCSQQLTAAELSEAAAALFVPMQGDAVPDEEFPTFTESHYEDGSFNTVDVEYAGMNVYEITIGLYRLASLEGEGRWEEESLKFTVTAPDGSSIDGRFFPCVDADGFSLCFTDSKWSLLESGTTFDGFLPAQEASMDHPVVLTDYLVDIGTITEFDEAAAMNKLEERYLGGGCTCVVTQVDGKNLVGRNMDLSLSENTAFKFVLDINEYKAIGIAYSPFMKGITFEEVVAGGVPEGIRAVLPYNATDYLNEAGLYIETNMRNNEEGYINHGTNPDSDIKIFAASVPGYVATRCKTVDEVVELIKTLNIYTAEKPVPWNFSFTIADAEGNYGVLEIAKDKVSFLPGQNGQANYYVTPEFAESAKFPSGKSRFAVLNESLDKVTTPEQMLKHMEKVFYSQCYNANHLREAAFDIRSEFAHTFPVNAEGKYDKENGSVENCTTAWITDDSRIDEVYDLIRQYTEANFAKYYTDGVCNFDAIRADAKNLPDYWVSAYSVAVDCSAKTMTARFWEDTTNNLVFSFGE